MENNTKDNSTQDSYYLKLVGKASIPEPLDIGNNFQVAISGSITSKTESDNDDGSHSHYYKLEPVLVSVITPTGKTIKAKDIRGSSVRLRSAMWRTWAALGDTGKTFDEYYAHRMEGLILDELKNI